jgi:(1->4)-alpha-D-glucan 1-alpha-D-glucosylmutase
VDGAPVPSPDDEYLLYQTLVGAWPIELLGPDEPAALPLERFRERINAYMIKAVREAKQSSNWVTPNTQYEAALSSFVHRLLDWDHFCTFLADLQAFATRIALPGMINSLAQAVLKLTIPGIPDIYQGCEFWDLNLVDPDNRRPVDFKRRSAALDMMPRLPASTRGAVTAMLENWHDGNIKLYATAELLAERHRRPLLFSDGVYTALNVTGERTDNLLAFTRTKDEAAVAVAVPRLVVSLGAGEGRMPIGDAWTDSAVVCPPTLAGRRWTNVFTGEVVALHGEGQDHVWKARDLFVDLPIAALIASEP